MFMFFILFLPLFFVNNNIFGAEVPICSGIDYNGIIKDSNEDTILTYSYKLDVTFNTTTSTNNVRITKFSTSSTKHMVYYYTKVFFDVKNQLLDGSLNLTKGTADFSTPNAAFFLNHWFTNSENYSMVLTNGITLFVYDGVLFNGISGSYMDESNNFCLNYDLDCIRPDLLKCNDSVCCSKIDRIDILNEVDEICETFETDATIPTYNADWAPINYTFHAKYEITSKNLEIIFPTTPDVEFTISVMNNILNNCSSYSQPSSTCKTVAFPLNDFQWEINFNFFNPEAKEYSVGEFARLNGTFYKNINIPFTSTDPCIKYSGEYEAKFCCTHFTQNPTTPFQTTLIKTDKSSTKKYLENSTFETSTEPISSNSNDLCGLNIGVLLYWMVFNISVFKNVSSM